MIALTFERSFDFLELNQSRKTYDFFLNHQDFKRSKIFRMLTLNSFTKHQFSSSDKINQLECLFFP